MSELVQNPAETASGSAQVDLVKALSGSQAGRDRAVAHKTRRVVMASLGVLQEQKAGRKHSRSVAVAASLLVVLGLGPFFWRVADDLIGGEHIGDLPTELSLWVCILCPAMLAAALVAGWSRK